MRDTRIEMRGIIMRPEQGRVQVSNLDTNKTSQSIVKLTTRALICPNSSDNVRAERYSVGCTGCIGKREGFIL